MMEEHRCRYCQGQLEPQRVTRVQNYRGSWAIIENLPALVCKQCGERYYTPEMHDLVVALISGKHTPTRTETLEVYDAANAA